MAASPPQPPKLDQGLFNFDETATSKEKLIQAQAGFQAAQQQYQNVLGSIRQHRTSLIQQGEMELRQLSELYKKKAASIPQEITKVDETLGNRFDKAQADIESHTRTVDDSIIQAYRTARHQLSFTTRSARSAVNQNARTAQTQVTTILANLSRDFVSVLTDAKSECGSAADLAAININQWERSLNQIYPLVGSSKMQAKNEAYRKAAPGLAQTAITQLNLRRNQTLASFDESTTQVTETIKQSVNPTLQSHATEIGIKGNEAITTAKQIAAQSLLHQADEARKAVMQMRTDILNQLVSQRSALRSQLFNQGQQAIAQMQRQTRTAQTVITSTVQTGLPGYKAAATQLHSSLTQTAQTQPKALKTTAPKAAGQIHTNLRTGRALQDKQIKAVRSGATKGLAQKEQQTIEDIQIRSTTAQSGITTSQAAAIKNLDESAEASTKGFSKVSKGVVKAAEVWSLPLAEVFKTYLESAKEQIMEGYPAFLLQVNQSSNNFTRWVRPQLAPITFFAPSLTAAWTPVLTDLKKRVRDVGTALTDAGIINDTDEAGVTNALRGLTKVQGNYVRSEYKSIRHRHIEEVIREELWDSDDINAALSYLNGKTAEGARFELDASIHWYNDEESRIEGVLRSLNTEELQELHRLDRTGEVLEDVRGALGGTDRAVFDALTDATNEARFARADVYRMRDRINEERRRDNDESLNTVLTEYSKAGEAQNYGGQAISAEERRRLIQQEFAAVQGIDLQQRAADTGQTVEQAASEALFTYATRDIQEEIHTEGGSYTITKTVEGAQRDLARALIFQGDGSVQTRAARLGVELERSDQPNLLNLDTALVDPRLNADYMAGNPAARDQARQQALQDRADVFRLTAERYGSSPASGTGTTESSQTYLIEQFSDAYGSDEMAASVAEGLIRDDYPTPATAALAMEYAVDGLGTDNALMERMLGRMNRDEVATMRGIYDQKAGNDFYEDLGVYGQGLFGDLSGSDRLKVERLLLGQPRNARERAEVAAFAIDQQRRETSGLGSWLAEGSFQADALAYDEQQLSDLTGIGVTFQDGTPSFESREGAFTAEGAFTGDSAALESAIASGQISAQSYGSKIDQYATVAATTVAIAGAIAAAIATVATGGAASPLLLAAIAGITGLVGMGTQAAIKGGRYGWEDAATDLGMTAVQALTAGVGQGLGLASRGGVEGLKASARTGLSISAARQLSISGRLPSEMVRLTGSEFADKILIGMATGGLGSLGQTALTEQTYANNKGAENLLASLFRGMLSGAVTSGISNGIEDGTGLGAYLGSSTNMFGRGLGKSVSSGVGAFGGKGAELGFESARGTYRGDAGDIFVASLEAGGQSALQSFGEGGFEARAQGRYNRWQTAAEAASQATPRSEADTAETPTVVDAPDSQRIRPLAPDIELDLPPAARIPSSEDSTSRTSIEPQSARSETPADAQPSRFTDTLTEGFPAVVRPPQVDNQPPIQPSRFTDTLTEGFPAVVRPADIEDQRQQNRQLEDDSVTGRVADAADIPPDSTEASVRGRDFDEGAAAAVAGSRFQGDALAEPPGPLSTRGQQNRTRRLAERALASLVEGGGLLSNRARMGGNPDHIVLSTAAGEIGAKLTVVADMPADSDGTIPVARFVYDESTRDYQISLSARAHPDAIARALAHELTEISVGHGREMIADALRPGGLGARPLSEGETPQLSAHDQARLAELDVLGRLLHEANAEGNQPRAAQIRDEAERLALHLGLVGDSDAVMARRQVVSEVLSDHAIARVLLFQSADRVADNPFLQPRSNDIAADLELLTRQLTRAQEIGDSGLVEQVLELARRRILTNPLLVKITRRRGSSAGFNLLPIQRLIDQSHSPAQLKSLIDSVKRDINSGNSVLDNNDIPTDPARIDPHQSEVVRQQFGDRPHFQDWAEFRQRFFDSRSSYFDADAEHLAYAFSRWASGDFVGESGALSSLISAVRRPDPGYRARYIEDGPVSRPEAVPDSQHVLPTGETVDQAVADRVRLIGDRTALEQELANPQTTAARAEEIDAQLKQIGRDINVRSEQLGEAAGRQIASQQPGDWTEIPIPRAGAGVPDLVFESPDGRLLMIEAKGGTSELGVRRSVDRTRLVQQGTREYAESLAAEMMRSTDTRIRELGQKIELALAAEPPNLDYLVVRQPFNDDGSLASPEIGTFDISRPQASQEPMTAASIPGSRFRGNLLETHMEIPVFWEEVKTAVSQLSQSSAIGRQIKTEAGNPVMELTTATGEIVRVLLKHMNRKASALENNPVAEINSDELNPSHYHRAEYVIELSRQIQPWMVERALAHEFSEIYRSHKAERTEDVLKSEATNLPLTAESKLSPHDYGRLAELEVLSRQLESAPADVDRFELQEETFRLLDHIGLTGNTESAQHRRRFVQERIEADSLGDSLDINRLVAEQEAAFKEKILRTVWDLSSPEALSPHLSQKERQQALKDLSPRGNRLASGFLEDVLAYIDGKGIRGDKSTSDRIVGRFDGKKYSDSGQASDESRSDTSAETGKQILYLGEGRLAHLEKYVRHPNDDVTVTTLITQEAFGEQSRKDAFASNIEKIEEKGIQVRTQFDALAEINRGEPFSEIYFDFPRLSGRDENNRLLRNQIEKNARFVGDILSHMREGRFMDTQTDVVITLGLENQYFNPIQLLTVLRQEFDSTSSPLHSFSLKEITLVHNKSATTDDKLDKVETTYVPFSVQMKFRTSSPPEA
ncbi:hypothetical protein [cf. Phormidesmis sp. LEGE 11477]|uniref:hypothetical protein n=1 Tax=cf. Phormidesmis sp. LEGE 11477 TaxID=1828680 RepID=UPI001D13F5BD|nr:hypothetical protein [cf. Phormidesmis sp. LEGE 11477]